MNSLVLRIFLHPNASRDEIVGFKDDVLRINVTPFPINGAANKRFIKVLSEELTISKSKIKIIKGEKNRNKTIEISDTLFKNVDDLRKFLHRRSSK